jgi:two-component system, cell cycle response regulator
MPLRNDDTARPHRQDAALVIIYGDELGKLYNLSSSSAVIGRSSQCEIQVDQTSISRNHSKIMSTGKTVLIRDLGSTNGTYVNDQPIEEFALRDGDLIKVGRTIFKFLAAGNIERSYHEQMHRLAVANQAPQGVPSADKHAKTTTMTLTEPEEEHGDAGPEE